MVYRRRKRRSRRGRKRRKMSFTRRVKTLIKRDNKKHTEMKYVESALLLTAVPVGGLLLFILPIAPAVPAPGALNSQRVGNSVNIWRMMINGLFLGPLGTLSQSAVRMRAIVAYSRTIPAAADFPVVVDGFMIDAEMKEKGIYIVSDRTYTFQPQFSTLAITAPNGVIYQGAGGRNQKTFKKKLKFKGRKLAFDNAGAVSSGFFMMYVVGEQNLALETCRVGWNQRTYYTDT